MPTPPWKTEGPQHLLETITNTLRIPPLLVSGWRRRWARIEVLPIFVEALRFVGV